MKPSLLTQELQNPPTRLPANNDMNLPQQPVRSYSDILNEYIAKEFTDKHIRPKNSQWGEEKQLLRQQLDALSENLRPKRSVDLDIVKKRGDLEDYFEDKKMPRNRLHPLFVGALKTVEDHQNSSPKSSPRSAGIGDDDMFEFEPFTPRGLYK